MRLHVVDAEAAMVPVALPFPENDATPDERLLFEFYGRIFERMQEAVADRDPAQLDALLASYDRPRLPAQPRAAGDG